MLRGHIPKRRTTIVLILKDAYKYKLNKKARILKIDLTTISIPKSFFHKFNQCKKPTQGIEPITITYVIPFSGN